MVGEGPRAPALSNYLVNGGFCCCWFFNRHAWTPIGFNSHDEQDWPDRQVPLAFSGIVRLADPALTGHKVRFYAAAFWMSSASIVILTSSPTITPPPSTSAFQTNPKSFRLIFAVAVTPAL